MLFNYYLADFPTPPPNIKLMKYADDITIYTSGPVVASIINGLIIYLPQVLSYIKKTDCANGQIDSNTCHTKYSRLHPHVKSAYQVLPLAKKPNLLAVTLDTHLTFTHHCNNIAEKVKQPNYVLIALTGSTCGCDKETLLATYQAIGRSILSYCIHIWTPSH